MLATFSKSIVLRTKVPFNKGELHCNFNSQVSSVWLT